MGSLKFLNDIKDKRMTEKKNLVFYFCNAVQLPELVEFEEELMNLVNTNQLRKKQNGFPCNLGSDIQEIKCHPIFMLLQVTLEIIIK